MLKSAKTLLLAASCFFMLTCTTVAEAKDKCKDSCHDKERTCNSSKHHPSKYVGVYYRSNIQPELLRNSFNPIFTLNENGTAIYYDQNATQTFVTLGTQSPYYGNWKELDNCQVLVTVIGSNALETPNSTPPADFFEITRFTYLLDFSGDINNPVVIARTIVDITNIPSSMWLSPGSGTLITSNFPTPRPLTRLCALDADLNRTQ